MGALLGEEEVFAEAGDLIIKPRGQWHTFWNAGDVPARILEIISLAGLENLFRELDTMVDPPDPETIVALAARYGAQADFERTLPIVERHGLVFQTVATVMGARTPEELETLLEDALILRDREALAQLFEPGAVLVAGGGLREARGKEIARLATGMWEGERVYLADPRLVLQGRDTALVLARSAINVSRRDDDGCWRYTISFLEPEKSTKEARKTVDNPQSP